MTEDNGGWPVDKNGIPLVRISYSYAKKIPTGPYANVETGPCSITRLVKFDKVDEVLEEISEQAENLIDTKGEQILNQLENG